MHCGAAQSPHCYLQLYFNEFIYFYDVSYTIITIILSIIIYISI